MKSEATAVTGTILAVVGFVLYGVADLRFGGWLAVVGLLMAAGAMLTHYAWSSTHHDDQR
jgi:hypothetical protein